MSRLYIAAVAGLCVVGPGRAQEGTLAPTAPVVPPPVLQNGSLVAPSGGGSWGAGGNHLLSRGNWSPVRSPVAAAADPGPAGYAVPALPAGTANPCAPTGCGTAGCKRGGLNWDRLKAWLCFHYSPTELPKLRPTPYVTPIQGLFSCQSAGGCATGCAAAPGNMPGVPPAALPQPQPPQMTPPLRPGMPGALMPQRGPQGAAFAPTVWQNPAPAAPTEFGTVGSKGAPRPGQAPVVNAGYGAPSK